MRVRSVLLSEEWNRASGQRTHRVVSWLMLEKDELVRELILLLLRSLEKKKNQKTRHERTERTGP